MRLRTGRLLPDVLDGVLQILFSAKAGRLPGNGLPLYNFDQWGLPPEGHKGPRDKPFLATPEPEGVGGMTPPAETAGSADDPPPRAAPQHSPAPAGVGSIAQPEGAATTPRVT